MKTLGRETVARSPEWPRLERAHLQVEPECVCCGPLWRSSTAVRVHHIFPVHYCRATGRPDLELDSRNLVTLRESEEGKPGQNHLLLVGHLGDFELANPASRLDAPQTYRGLDAATIRRHPTWLGEVEAHWPLLAQMTAEERQAFRDLMDRTMPLRLST